MAAVAEQPSEKKPNAPPPNDLSSTIKSKALEEAVPWIDYAAQQALIYQKTMQETLDAAIKAFRSRFSEIRSTSSAHLQQTINSLEDVKSELGVYENIFFGKVKEGVQIAASRPLITGGIAFGLGLVVFKRPRRFLYYNTLQLFVSEESLFTRADAKVKELRQSISFLKAESDKLERRALLAEEEFIRGRKKLRQAGKQIDGVIHTAYKIERQAAGLKDVLGELPSRAASRFRSEVSGLASEAKKERNALTKEVTKISNYGISV
uniref:Uncharacterized protein n=1 Tax=Rhizophora mucronata TaxID=61149 RepID=A0A2P2JS95_RHIMU